MADASTPQPIHLKDYRVPDYLVDRVDLDVRLDPASTEVTARLAIRRNPAAGDGQPPLVLDGQELELVGVRLDGEPLGANRYSLDDEHLTIEAPPAAFELEITSRTRPDSNTALEGLYLSNGVFCTQCESEGFRRITWFPDRPDVMAVYRTRIEADREKYPVLLSNGNLVEQGELAGRPPFRGLARPVPEALLPVRAGGGRSRPARGPLRHPLRARRAAGDLCRGQGHRQVRPRHGVAQARDEVGRGAVRPGIRPRPLHDRGGVRLQLWRDGEQGPEHLQHQVCPGQARDRDRHRSSSASRPWWRTSTFTTGPATGSPAATGSSCRSRKA